MYTTTHDIENKFSILNYRFLKSTAFEIQVPDEATEGGRYSPRFIDEITDEIDVLEDKKAPLFSKFFFLLFILIDLL